MPAAKATNSNLPKIRYCVPDDNIDGDSDLSWIGSEKEKRFRCRLIKHQAVNPDCAVLEITFTIY